MKRTLIFALCAVLALSLFGCTSAAAIATQTQTGTDYSNTDVTGQVTAIDGDSFTLLLGEITESDMSQVPAGEAPSGDASANRAPSGETPVSTTSPDETPSEQTSENMPSPEVTPSNQVPSGDQAPAGGRGFGPAAAFTPGEESITITIGQSASITLDDMSGGTEGTKSDIAVGDVLTVSFSDDNTVTAVVVKNLTSGNHDGRPGDGNMVGGPGAPGEGPGTPPGDKSTAAPETT